MSGVNPPGFPRTETPETPPRLSVIEVLAVVVVGRLTFDPSMPSALAVVALAGAWALEKIFVSHARVYRNASIDARDAATEAEKAAVEAKAAADALEGRLQRLENRAGWLDAQRRT